MEQLRVIDLTRHEAEENMRHMQILCKERHDKSQQKHIVPIVTMETLRYHQEKPKQYDILKEKTIQAMDHIKNSLGSENFKPPTTLKA